ncbi:3423_t:CDS:2 [Funneliformis mosseae]|uniref:3423_t:CDS:1 n=1 Tax=Funneliformis mosseae TaxID=27381 RepID=A0A9N9GQY9_FUNMO|nr:3423_t:CDS:2 [Funneliformis mosseae]
MNAVPIFALYLEDKDVPVNECEKKNIIWKSHVADEVQFATIYSLQNIYDRLGFSKRGPQALQPIQCFPTFSVLLLEHIEECTTVNLLIF